jgi:predicted transcriptional regulator
MKYKNIVPARPYINSKLKDKTIRILFEEEKNKTEIARIIRTIRKETGLSQRQLAKMADTTQAVIARLESGMDRRMPSLMLLFRIMRALNATLELKCTFKKAA